MHKKISLYIVILASIISLLVLNKKNIDFESYSIIDEGNQEEIPQIDLYTYHYSTKAIDKINNTISVTNSERKNLGNLDIKQFAHDNNKGSLYDIWLYTHSLDATDVKVEQISFIINFLNELQAEEGFFLSYKKEYKNGKENNYILSTKMALDIYRYYNHPIPNVKYIKEWLNKVIYDLGEKDDFVTIGSYVYLMKVMEKYIVENSDNSFFLPQRIIESFMEILKELYEKEEESVEKYDTALKLNSLFKKSHFEMDKDVVSYYFNSIQLENGSFPLYGVIAESDVLTTYLVVNISRELNISIPNKHSLLEYLMKIQGESIF
ncbi:hypothetical protein [Paenibacillus apiarius]|uniref:hypothetical protein n=1 Tax=Paenibacillus apiarius TaxID=46240 RepID=UPI00197DACBC|nr:hypothetical protein [Paenibacillus apiarius]MBN3525180.1 hypothetical protein [Paenibacillus apiarius]